MNTKQFAALAGFAFVAAWIGFGFGDAILCLLGAAVFTIAVAVRSGELDLADLQAQLADRQSGSTSTSGQTTRRTRGL